MLNLNWTKIFSEEELFAMRVNAVTRFLSCETAQAVEASIELAKYLNQKGLNSQNYPLVLELLREENFNVIEALLTKTEAFTYFTKVQAGPYIIDFALRMLDKYPPGRMYEKTLQIIFGILYRTYHSPKEGYQLFRLKLEHINSIGKFLDKSKGQKDPNNRFILDILGDLGGFKSINNENPDIDRLAAHAINMRNAFFDRTLDMNSVIPAELLVREDYRKTAVMPRDVVPFNA
jgi:hypothetical protein